MANVSEDYNQKISKAFEELGKTVSEVRDYLAAHNIRGNTCSNHSCPIANFLKVKIVGEKFKVEDFSTVVWSDKAFEAKAVVRNPPHVKEFIRSFDQGLYPELRKT